MTYTRRTLVQSVSAWAASTGWAPTVSRSPSLGSSASLTHHLAMADAATSLCALKLLDCLWVLGALALAGTPGGGAHSEHEFDGSGDAG